MFNSKFLIVSVLGFIFVNLHAQRNGDVVEFNLGNGVTTRSAESSIDINNLPPKEAIDQKLKRYLQAEKVKKQATIEAWAKAEREAVQAAGEKWVYFHPIEEVRSKLEARELQYEQDLAAKKVALEQDLKRLAATKTRALIAAQRQAYIQSLDWTKYEVMGRYDFVNEAFKLNLAAVGEIILKVPKGNEAFNFAQDLDLDIRQQDFALTEKGWQFKSLEIYHRGLEKTYQYDRTQDATYNVIGDLSFEESLGETQLSTDGIENVNIQYEDFVEAEKKPEVYNIWQNLPQRPVNPNAYALVIGLRTYKKLPNAPVKYALNDAGMMKKYLLALGFQEKYIMFLKNPTRTELGDVLDEGDNNYSFEKRVSLGDKEKAEVFIFVSGHGMPDTKNGSKPYILASDGNPYKLETGGYSLDDLLARVKALPAAKKTVILDVCFSGQTGSSKVVDNVSISLAPDMSLDHIPNTVVISATTDKQFANWYVEAHHGLLTYYFLKAIHQGNADADQNGGLTYNEILKYITKGISDYTLDNDLGLQTPTHSGAGDMEKTLFQYK